MRLEPSPFRLLSLVARSLCIASTLLVINNSAGAQSLDISAPTAVTSNQISGKIVARDIGDARLTSHFYVFAGTRGDLHITVLSSNLNGDIDVFTADGLRPLLKFTLYAESPTSISKSFYLRKQEDLILRVEARTPNDDEGAYEVTFGGSFEPLTAPLVAQAEPTQSPSTSPSVSKNSRRVSSVGARIAEPEPPVPATAEATVPEPSPTATNEATSAAAAEAPTGPTTSVIPEKAGEPESSKPGAPARSRRSSRRRGTKSAEVPKKPITEEGSETKTEAAEEKRTQPTPTDTANSANKGRGGRRRQRATEQPPVQPEANTGPRLIIQTSDGTLIERYMSSVRRVLIEQGQVVVVGKDGRVDRILLAQVVKMSIEQ